MDVIKDSFEVAREHWVLSSLLLLVLLIYAHYVATFTTLKKLGIKGPTPLPLVGNAISVIVNGDSLHDFISNCIKKYGSVFGLYFNKDPCIVVSDPEMIKTIMVKDFEKFHDRPDGGLEFPEPLASMLTVVTGQRWKHIRSILTPTFTSGKLKSMMYIMHEAGDVLVKKMETAAKAGTPIDIHEWQQGVTMEVILSAAFGVKAECQTNAKDKITGYARNAMNPKPWPNLAVMIPFIGPKIGKAIAISPLGFSWGPMIDIAKGIIKNRQNNPTGIRKDMLELMLAAQHPDKKGHILSDDELIAEMVLFLLAGYDTSSNVLSLLCYHLAVYPEIQEKLVEEIKQVCELPDTTNYEEIKNMPYLEACISETLRLYPPGFIISRTVDESCTIEGVPFKKGMSVLIPVYSIQRDEKYWPEPEAFKPERFMPENKESLNQFAYLPFGAGPRNCIGMRFAQMEIKTVMTRLLQRYRLVRAPETPVPISVKPRAVLAPAEQVWIKIEKRE
eukprot:Seg1845.6 transcript_id=Seg1845.6/GoldUCD/mRNA.D3Y31 product="Cytochrome P450 3A24" protein_id=Seg1845.6/GoldUCD/D3Y31